MSANNRVYVFAKTMFIDDNILSMSRCFLWREMLSILIEINVLELVRKGDAGEANIDRRS